MIVAQIETQGIHKVGIFYLFIEWRERSKMRDPDNIAAAIKYILDGFQAAGIIPGDGWRYNLGWENSFRKTNTLEEGVSIKINGYASDSVKTLEIEDISLTEVEVSEILDIYEDKLRLWRVTGIGPDYITIGRDAFYSKKSVYKFKKERISRWETVRNTTQTLKI